MKEGLSSGKSLGVCCSAVQRPRVPEPEFVWGRGGVWLAGGWHQEGPAEQGDWGHCPVVILL